MLMFSVIMFCRQIYVIEIPSGAFLNSENYNNEYFILIIVQKIN